MPTNFKHEDKSLRRPRPKNTTVSKARARKRRASEALKKKVYALVDKRDKGYDRATGEFIGFNLEHHHILPRSRGGKHTTANVCSVTHTTHELIHAKRLRITGDANGPLVVSEWNSIGECERTRIIACP